MRSTLTSGGPRLRIGFDVRGAAEAERRGIGHYVVQVLGRILQRHGDEHDWRGLCLGARPDLIPAEITDLAKIAHRRVGKLTVHYLVSRACQRCDDRFLGPLDAFFVPSAHLLTIDRSLPSVVTVHDAFWSTAPQYMSIRERVWHQLVAPDRVYRRAHRLLANSDTTAARVRELLPAVADRIAVIPHGVDPVYATPLEESDVVATLARLQIRPPYILFLGGVEPRKNVRRLIDGFHLARRRGLEHRLVIAGQISVDSRAELLGMSLTDVQVLGWVAEEDKPALYAGATAFALPAYDEGLGLPPLEALACGTPSLVSTLEIFDETLGPAAIRADPDDIEEIADGLLRLCTDASLRRRLLQEGRLRLARYDWDACAEATYEEIVAAARRTL